MLDCHIKNAWAKKYILIHLVGRRQNQVHITAQKSKWCKSSLNWMKLCTMMWEIFILESYSMSISYFTFKRIFSTKIQIVISKRVQRLHFWKCFSWKERAGPKVNKSYYIMNDNHNEIWRGIFYFISQLTVKCVDVYQRRIR